VIVIWIGVDSGGHGHLLLGKGGQGQWFLQ
jgi:hypothetical protein